MTYREQVAKALYKAMPLVSELPRGPAHIEQMCSERLAPLVEAAIEAAVNCMNACCGCDVEPARAAALSVLEGKEKQ